MKYPRYMYTQAPFYDFGPEAEHFHQKLTKCRKDHKCSGCGLNISAGDKAVNISAVFPHEGGWKNIYICEECMNKKIESIDITKYIRKTETTIGELLPLLRSQMIYPDEGQEIILAMESEEWTWVRINASNGLLDDLADLTVQDIDTEAGAIRLWILTDEECHPIRNAKEELKDE